jgi:hypothetical protein
LRHAVAGGVAVAKGNDEHVLRPRRECRTKHENGAQRRAFSALNKTDEPAAFHFPLESMNKDQTRRAARDDSRKQHLSSVC